MLMSDVAKTIQPLGDRVVVTRLEAEEKTKSGIIIPENAKEKPQQGLVVAVGPGKFDEDGERMPMDVKVGDKVLFGKWGATEVKLDGVEVLVLKQDDIIGILKA
jgi:chaperonin GroES